MTENDAKIVASLTDDYRCFIYDHNIFIIQATGPNVLNLFTEVFANVPDKVQCLYLTGFSSLVMIMELQMGQVTLTVVDPNWSIEKLFW